MSNNCNICGCYTTLGDRHICPKPAPKAQDAFDHPCKQTCSGWKQGYEKGREDGQKIGREWCQESAKIKQEILRQKNDVDAIAEDRKRAIVKLSAQLQTANKALEEVASWAKRETNGKMEYQCDIYGHILKIVLRALGRE